MNKDKATKNPTDRLKCLDPDIQPPTKAVDDSSESATKSTPEASPPHEPSWAARQESRVDRVAALVTALASKQLELERYERENVELNSRISSQTARLKALKAHLRGASQSPETRELESLAPRLDDRIPDRVEDDANIHKPRVGGEGYAQALHAQTGKLDGMLDTLSQTHTWVAELDSALDQDLNACNELASKMQEHEVQLAELETLVDQVCGAAEQSDEETLENAAEAEPTDLEDLETLTDVHTVNRLLVAMNGDHVIKYPLYKSIVTIGRGPFNDIQIRTQYVSRSHARIVTSNSDAIIEDMDSKNGITVNGRSVQLRRLRNGDVVDVGKIHFKFIDLMDDDAGEGNA